MSKTTPNETPEQALERIQSMGFGKNDALVIMAFSERGIDPEQIDPRHNVLTFNAWKAKGRCVAKGAISVRVTTWIPCKPTKKQQAEGEEGKKLRPKTVSLFHESQTKPKGAPKDERPAAWHNEALIRPGTYADPGPGDDNVDKTAKLVDQVTHKTYQPTCPDDCTEKAGEVFDKPAVLFERKSDGHVTGYRREESPAVEPWTESTTLAQVEAEMREQLTGQTPDPATFTGPTVGDLDKCTCPMAGVVTNVDCPQHGTRKAVTV